MFQILLKRKNDSKVQRVTLCRLPQNTKIGLNKGYLTTTWDKKLTCDWKVIEILVFGGSYRAYIAHLRSWPASLLDLLVLVYGSNLQQYLNTYIQPQEKYLPCLWYFSSFNSRFFRSEKLKSLGFSQY